MTRKSFADAIEHLFTSEKKSIVRINEYRGKKYEIRARHKAHGVELDWGLPGTFFCPEGYDNE